MSDGKPPLAGSAGAAPISIVLFVSLGLLSTFGPISLDLYLPSVPALAAELHTSTSAAQLSISFCLAGLACGQLIAGPLSDRYGRRRPLIVGLIGYLLASAACAFAPTIEVLLILRLVQGTCGAAGVVISRAIARDLVSGRQLVIFLARLMLINGLAPVLAPVIGGQLAGVMSWRGIFGVLAGFGVVLLICGVFGVRETLEPRRRTTGGVRSVLGGFRVLARDPVFAGTAVASGMASAAMFAYIAGSTFVLQRIYGLSVQQFSLAFAVNAVGIMIVGQIAGRLARTQPPGRLLAAGLVQNLLGATIVLVATTVPSPTGGRLGLAPLLVGLFVMVSAIGLSMPTSAAIALANYPERAGAAASLMGLFQYVCGALVAPLVGIAGETAAAPMGIVACSASVVAMLAYLLVVRPGLRRAYPLQHAD